MNTFRLLLLTLLFTAIPFKGFSYTDNQIVKFGKIHYKVVSGTKHTLCFLGVDDSQTGNLVIPATVTDVYGTIFTVVRAEYSPFYFCKNITSIELPETMKSIGGYAFPSAKLKSMNIPKSMEQIDEVAWGNIHRAPKFTVAAGSNYFENDANGVLYSKGGAILHSVPSEITLTGGKYVIDSRVKQINKGAFQNVQGLRTIVFPKDLETILYGYPTIAPTSTLAKCEIAPGAKNFSVKDGVLFKGTSLVLYPRGKSAPHYKVPDGITTIERYAISNSFHMETIDLNGVTNLRTSAIYAPRKLTTITLPKDIKPHDWVTKTGMEEGCFEECERVTEYKVKPENKYFVAEDGVIFSKKKDTLFLYPANKPGITYTVPNTVKRIGAHSFQSAQNITSFHFPDNVESIGADALRAMPKLTKVTFGENSKVTHIGYYAFRACNNLREVTLPKSLGYLGEIFYMCENLEVVNVPAGSNLYEIAGNALKTNRKLKAFNFKGDCGLNKISNDVFANLALLESFNIPKSVTLIEANAFIGCTSLKTVTFDPDAEIEKIGEGAFADCGITSIKIPKNVEQIEREAFLKCEALHTINVTKTTTSISPEAFKYCSNLTAINVDKDNEVYSSIDGYLLSKSKKTLMIFPPGKASDKFTPLPPSITTIGDYAFYDCKKLENVTIPNKVDSIGIRAFGLCENLNTITFLCDQMINPKKINQAQNEQSFDADKGGIKKMGKIKINVRKDKLSTYNNNPFYKKFASISPSFESGTEEYIVVSEKAVDLLSTTRTDHTFILPTKIQHNGKDYEVSVIGDYAFENAPSSIEEVVVKTNVGYIGAKAFVKKNNKLKSVFFIESKPTKGMLGTTRFELDATGTNYNEFDHDTKIYVKKSAYDKYKTEWTKTVYNPATLQEEESSFNFTDQIEYKIKDAQISHRYTTFAREFDVDFRDCALSGGMNVAAFISGQIKTGSGDHGETTTHHVRMKSIDLNGGVSDSYAYIPANTGVLLKVFNKTGATSGKLYYTIGEKDNVTYTISNNIMKGVTVSSKPVSASGSSPIYVLQGGIFRKATSTINDFPVHKAYMVLPSGAPAKLSLSFGDDDETTDIESITTDEETKDNDVYYNLNGQRVSNPQKGVYIHNGKKVIIK